MPAYAYQAVDPAGRRRNGRSEAASPAALMRALEERGLLVVDVADADRVARGPWLGTAARRGVLETTRALAVLLSAGMPLARALATAGQLATGALREAIDAVRVRVERGAGVAASLAEHPRYFSPLYVGIVRAGEKSGDVAAAFHRLTDHLEREDRLRERLVSASVYPLLLAAFGGLAIVVLMFFVLPRFVDLLQGTGAALPRSTAALLAVSELLRQFWYGLIVLPLVPILLAAWARGSEDGRRAMAMLTLRLPVIGRFRRGALTARFARLLGVLLGGGAPLYNALGDTCDSLHDPLARDEVARIQARVREGASLNGAIAETAFFPDLLSQLVAVGEESSRVEEFLLKAADIFEDRTDQATQRLVALAEPAMIIAFGTAVAFVALSLLQAIYGVNAGAFR
jgi:general secretion pathway protein F